MSSYRDFRPTRRFGWTIALSPDGSRVTYTDDATGQFNAAVQSISGGLARRITRYVDQTVRRVAWHPDGRSLVFTADVKGDESTQLYRIGLDDDEPVAITDTPNAQYDLALGNPISPDGRLLAFTGNDRSDGDQDVLVHDLTTGEVRRLYAGGGRVYAGHWSPDGSRLTAADWVEGNSEHIVYVIPVDGGPAIRLTPEGVTATYWLGPWLPDGSGFLVYSNAGREFTGLGVLDAVTGELCWLDTPDWEITEATLSADGRVAVWTVNVDGAAQLRARDLTNGRDLAVPVLPAGETESLVVSSDGSLASMLLSTPTMPWNVVLVDLAAGELRWLTDAAPAAADPPRCIEPTLLRYPSRDGVNIPAYLYRPHPTAGPQAVVISIHGGPQAQERPRYVGIYQYLLSHGIAVLAPNVRGSTGYGRTHQSRVNRDWGGIDLQDWEAAVRYLHAQSWVDPSRIGLFGGSYGGFGVLSCLAKLPEFNWAAAVDLFGISNLVTLARASPPTWHTKVVRLIGDPDTDEESLLSRSPITYADNIRAPLLVIQGANDRRVPQAESDQIVQRLRARGFEVRYDVYPDEGHGFTRRDNQLKAESDSAEFLIAHLTR